ncbi:MAG: hypothetical protein V3U07_01825, partial [Nitrospirales bacterium]
PCKMDVQGCVISAILSFSACCLAQLVSDLMENVEQCTPIHRRNPVDIKPDVTTSELVHHDEDLMGFKSGDSHRKKSMLQGLSFI